MTTASELCADFAIELGAREIPVAVREAASLHFLDALGCGLAARAGGAAPYAAALGPDAPGAATAIGREEPQAADRAALVNGIYCHALDFDDTHPASVAHVSAVVVPAVLAGAEVAGASREELLAALVVGNEVTCRVGRPAGDAFHLRGFHPTAICGVFGATAACARLGGLDRDRTVQALGIAGSMASGLMAYLGDGSATKQIHPGWAAHGAHTAVALAAAGASGPATVLEGPNGLYSAFIGRGDVDPAEVAGDLGEAWETPRIAFKPYAACHFLHAPLDALLELRGAHGFDAEEVERITLLSPEAGVGLIADPLERKRRPATLYEAKFSAPFSFAAALVLGRTDPGIYDAELLGEADLLALADRVDYEVRDYETFPDSLPGGVRVALRGGEVLEHELPHQRGGAGNPMAADEVVVKYRQNAAPALPSKSVAALERAALDPTGSLAPFRVLAQAAMTPSLPGHRTSS
jgi:2-methylcitrate dehydratase PrpD